MRLFISTFPPSLISKSDLRTSTFDRSSSTQGLGPRPQTSKWPISKVELPDSTEKSRLPICLFLSLFEGEGNDHLDGPNGFELM